MYDRLLVPPEISFFLFGARGTGKTTWTRAAFPGATRFDLRDAGEYLRLLGDPEAFGRALARLTPGTLVVVDEVQRIPELLNEVHRAIEERGLRFVLLGSSTRSLRRAGVNLLGGPATRRTMGPLLPVELGADFDLDRALGIGTLPIVWTSSAPEEALEGYVEAYLSEEIAQEGLVRDLAPFVRALPVAALLHGRKVNVSNVARDAMVGRKTVEGYLDILEDTLVAWRLPGYEPRLRVRERSLPKLYVVDAGLARAMRRLRRGATSPERGALFEGWAANVLRTTFEATTRDVEMSYWSPAGSLTEVDFVLRRDDGSGGDEHVAIETKTAAAHGGPDLKGLRAIAGLPGLRRRILLLAGLRRDERTLDGIDVLTVRTFLDELAAGTLFAPAP